MLRKTLSVLQAIARQSRFPEQRGDCIGRSSLAMTGSFCFSQRQLFKFGSFAKQFYSSFTLIPQTQELLMRIELTTSSLPRKCSTPELQQLFLFTVAGCWLTAIRSKRITGNFQRTTYPLSGRRGSNPRPAAWKAAALPTELLPLLICRLNDCLSPE